MSVPSNTAPQLLPDATQWRVLARGSDAGLVVELNPDRPLTEDAAVEVVAVVMYQGFKHSFDRGESPMFLMQRIMGRLSQLSADDSAGQEGSDEVQNEATG